MNHISVYVAAGLLVAQVSMASFEAPPARDPGVRGGASGAGDALPGLTPAELDLFLAGRDDFSESESVDQGLGPRLNLDSCVNCHMQPEAGGSSPAVNPQVVFANILGGTDQVPSFITATGPVREARFIRSRDGSPDGGVHALFTLTRRIGAEGCALAQPDFDDQIANRNVVFRIPTPIFGAGLIEQIPDSAILANQAANWGVKTALGIRGRPNLLASGRAVTGQTNRNGNDGTIARFGWKAQNKSLLLFAGEAYNVEMGISNDLFPTERDETPQCQFAPVPNSISNLEASQPIDVLSDIEKTAAFMRLSAPPAPSRDTPGGISSIANGRRLFDTTGCAYCHTPSFATGNSAVAALRRQPVSLYSDLLVHDMGVRLADGVSQGSAGGREFRTAPLWGLGKRLFFLHDGRTSDLLEAIRAHRSPFSEANGVLENFQYLRASEKQDLLNFLRAL